MNEKKSLPPSSSLPYEVRSEDGGGKNANKHNNITTKKRKVEAIIPSEKTDSVLSMLQSMNIQATFYESKGMGKGEKYMISYGKGGKTTKMPYSTRNTVVTIIDENKVGEVINAIRQSAKTESKSSNVGIIVISSVDDILTI
jgi:nitrogen regulatory protein PII